MKNNIPIRELLCSSLKKTVLIMRVAIFLLILGNMQAHAYSVIDRKIKLAPEYLAYKSDVNALIPQQQVVTGTITDSQTGEPMPGVNVIVQGTTIGTTTDIQGNYSLPVANRNVTLVFSFIGYVRQEIELAGRATLNVSLVSETTSLDEIVVVGYGTQTKRTVTGSISNVNEKLFNTGVQRTAADMLAGKVAGLVITQSSGDVTASQSLRLRGTSSLTGSSEPFFVIDGVPGLSMSSVAPQDIESISVLKDASATAIYGARSGSGVILITTKKAAANRSTLDYNGYVAFDQVTNKPRVLNATEWRKYMADNNIDPSPYDRWGADTDWFDEVSRIGITHNHDISFSGSSPAFGYRGSVSYQDQQGISRENYAKRLNTRLNISQKAFQDRLDMSVIGTINIRKYQGGNQFMNAGTLLPVYPVYLDNGDYWFSSDIANPVAAQDLNSNETLNYQMFINAQAGLKITKNLLLSFNGLTERETSDLSSFTANTTVYGGNNLGSASRSFSNRTRGLLETTLNYTLNLDSHNATLLGGFSMEDNYSQRAGASNRQFTTNIFGPHDLASGEMIQAGDATSSADMYRLMSYFGRLNYSYKGRYILTATLRRDGSSKFGSENKWGTFPSVSAAWRLIDEPFMASTKNVLNELKLRVGYGISGNQDGIAPYQSMQLFGAADLFWGSDGGWHRAYAINQNANPNLKWEETGMFNLGVDFAMFNSRINGTIEYYDKRTSNLLYTYQVPVPPYLYASMIANVGTMQNKGVEVELSGDIIRTGNIRWTIGINASHNKNTILKLSSGEFTTTAIKTGSGGMRGGGVGVTSHIIEEGRPVGQFYGPVCLGIDEETGNYILDDMVDGKPGSTVADYTYIGDAQPKLTYGINSSFTWKNFDFSFFLRGVYGNDVINFSTTANRSTLYLPGGNVLLESLTWPLRSQPMYNSLCIEDGSFARMENMNIAYTLNNKIPGITNLRLYFTVRNAFKITKYSGSDPEVSMTGLTPGAEGRSYYPVPRTYLLGFNFTF